MRSFSRGQAASEYVILLAVTLMVGLAATTLLTWAPGVGKDAKLRQSEAYWRSAQPFAIVGAQAAGNGTLSLKIQNNAAEALVLTGLGLNGTSYPVSSVYIGPGASSIVSLLANVSSGSGYWEGNVTFTYNSASFTNLVQGGNRNFAINAPTSINATQACIANGQACTSGSECCGGCCQSPCPIGTCRSTPPACPSPSCE